MSENRSGRIFGSALSGVAGEQECLAHCSSKPECVAVDMKTDSGDCWIYTTLPQLVSRSGFNHYVKKKVCPAEGTCYNVLYYCHVYLGSAPSVI